MAVYEAVITHPNIKGAKVSGRLEMSRQLIKAFGESFRVIVAEPERINLLLREGVPAHLDGMFAIAPRWVKAIATSASSQDWDAAAEFQRKLNDLRNLLKGASSLFGAFTAMMNARGISGRFHARPYSDLDETEREALLASPIMRELLGS
jgi:dihydrodipicolinate synthase/N-acetylneuraminate lyase